jgi:hypothetical protein
MADNSSTNPEAAPAATAARAPTLADDSGVPAGLTTIAIGIGFVLIVVGAAIMAFVYPRLFNAGSLAMCIGFGLVLAAFGTRAAGTWQTWSVAGSGGISIMLFLLLQALPTPQPDTLPFVRGNLHGTNEATSIRIFAAQFLLVGRSNASEHFRFVAFPEDVQSKNFYLFIVNERDPTMRESYIGCITTDLIKPRQGSTDWINLSIEKDAESKVYRLRHNLDGKEYGEFGSPNCREQGRGRPKAADASKPTRIAGKVLDWIDAGIATPAFAGKGSKSKGPGVGDLIKALEAESSDVRAEARDQLSEYADPASLALMTSTWDIKKSSYRGDLGRLVAWTNAIRENRDTAALVSVALSPEQLAYVVQLTGHPDKTMRYNATEVVSWMLQSTGWSKPPPPDRTKAIVSEVTSVFSGPDAAKISKPGTEFDFSNTAFNTLVAVDDAKCVLKPDARQSIATALAPFESKYDKELPKTVSLSQSVRATLAKPGC